MKMACAFRKGLSTAALLAAMALLAGCSIAVDKTKTGDDKNVRIDTPLGGVHVTSDSTTAADVGLPVYPGAHLSSADGKDHDQSADVHFGFGDWQFRVKVVKYRTPDSSADVLAFYRKALGRYGDVIQCDGRAAVGDPKVTHEGLGCEEDVNSKQKFDSDMSQSLKAGSKHHQHIVGIEKSDGSGTAFSLVELDLPIGSNGDNAESN